CCMNAFTGGCTCGAIRYEASAAPMLMLNCHCRDCQRASGSGYAAIAVFAKDALTIEGALRYHATMGESGNNVERGFCPTCGNPVAVKLGALPDIVGVEAASLDNPGCFKPTMDVFTASAHPWDHMDPSLAKKAAGPRS